MSITTMRFLESLSEPDFRVLVRDLLRSMGYRQVAITHGPMELGRDVVFLEEDKIGRKIWRGVQAKSKAVTGSLSSPDGARAIANQCEAALDTPFTDLDGNEVTLAEMWLAVSVPLSEQAKASVKGKLKQNERITILDATRLADLLDSFIPDLLETNSQPIEAYISRLTEFCDSPDEYVAAKLNAHYALSDLFVVPTVEVAFISPTSLSSLPSLANGLEFDHDDDSLGAYVALMPAATVHGSDVARVTRAYRSVADMASGIAALPWRPPSYERLAAIVDALDRQLGMGAYGIQLRDPQPMSRGISPLFVRRFESMFRDAIHPETIRIVKKEKELEFTIQRYGRQSFQGENASKNIAEMWYALFVDVAKSYREGTADLFAPLGAIVRAELLKQSSGSSNAILRAKSSYTESLQQLGHVDAELRERYRGLFIASGMDGLADGESPRLDTDESVNVVDELAKLSSFYKKFAGAEASRMHKWSAIELLGVIPKVIVKGDLGSGKTTLLKQACRLIASRNRQDGKPIRLPMLAYLGTLQEVGERPQLAVASCAKERFSSMENLSADEVSWILDGFDELGSERGRKQILEWITSPNQSVHHAILASRSFVLPDFVPGMTIASLRPFSHDQIVDFIGRFRWRDTSSPVRLIKVLESAPELMGLAQSPLLLTLIVILAQNRTPESLPKRREILYQRVVDLLLGEWDSSKGVKRPHVIEEDAVTLAILSRVAWNLYERGTRAFSRIEFLHQLVDAFSVRLDQKQYEELFNQLVRDCVLVPLTKHEYGFVHFSIQEYLAAVDLSRDISPKRLWQVVAEYFRSGWWQEVLIFYAGLKRDLSDVIPDLHKHVTGAGSSRTDTLLQTLLKRWVEVGDLTPWKTVGATGRVEDTLRAILARR